MAAIYDLQTIIKQQIAAADGRIGFDEYMRVALYHPQYGYYCSPDFSLGKTGDFTTAPELSPLFAECVARVAMQVFTETGETNVLEIGAGSGRLVKDMLVALAHAGTQPKHYFIYEISTTLRKKQQAFLQENCAELAGCVTWLDTLPVAFKGFVLANEVLDALPVSRVQITAEGIKECCVSWDGKQFAWELHKPLRAECAVLAQTIHSECALPVGYTTEIHTAIAPFMHSLADCLNQGLILLVDYGYGRREYYHPQRSQGSLTCFYKHHKHDDPFLYPGQQDITAHVDFTEVVENAAQHGCDILGFTTQSAFLFDCGLLDLAKLKNCTPRTEFEQNQAIKVLTMPTEMGEVIKVLGIGKKINFKPLGFGLLDRRRDL